MVNPVLARFDETLYKNKASGDSAQVPWAGARVDFYFQGATVNQSSAIGTGSQTVAITGAGALTAGCTVQVDVGGPTVTVTAVNSSTQITVNNNTGASIPVSVGTRLILVSSRPTVYSDPLGQTPVPGNSYVIADSNGRAAAYVAQSRFDYIATDAVCVDATSFATLTGNGPTLSWSHTNNGPNALVLVAVSWQETTGTESITSVTYGAQTMSLVTSSGAYENLYSVIPSSTGAHTITVTFSGTNAKGAVAGAASLTGVNQTTSLGSVVNANGNSTSPSASVTGTDPMGLVFNVLGLDAAATVTTIAPAGVIAWWNASAGSHASLTLTQGGGGTRPGNGGSVTSAWTLAASKLWGVTAVEAKPVTVTVPLTRLTIDAVGGSQPWVNAGDFATFQAAIDATPVGGVLFAPAGVYTAPDVNGWTLNNPITIIGNGAGSIDGSTGTVFRPFVFAGSTSNSTVFTINSNRIYLQHFLIAPTSEPSAGSGNGIQTTSSTVWSDFRMEDVNIWWMGNNGVHIAPTGGSAAFVLPVIRNCDFVQNKNAGLYAFGCSGLVLDHIYFNANRVLGCELNASSGAVLRSCYFEENALDSTDDVYNPQLYNKSSHATVITGCTFEDFQDGTNKTAITIENSYAVQVAGNFFINSTADLDTRAIYILSGSACCKIGTNKIRYVGTAVEIKASDSNQGHVVEAQAVDAPPAPPAPQTASTLKIRRDVSNIATPSAGNIAWPPMSNGLSSTRNIVAGILLPMIHSPSDIDTTYGDTLVGLLIYDATVSKLKFYDGSAWQVVTSV